MTVNTLGRDLQSGKARAAAWLPPLVPFAIATFALSALVSYHLRADGAPESRTLLQWGIVGIYQFVGFVPSFLFFLLVLSWSSIWFFTGRLERRGPLLLRLLGLTLALAIWVNLRADATEAPPHAGVLGAWIGQRMVSALGVVLSTLLVAPLTLVSLLLATDYFFISYFEGLGTGSDRAAATDDRARTEAGVEDEVTEEFKSLSRTFAPPRSATAVPPSSAAIAAIPVVGAGEPVATGHDEEDEEIDGDEPATGEDVGTPARKLSHFERRQLAAAGAADDERAAERTDAPAGEDGDEPFADLEAAVRAAESEPADVDEFSIAADAMSDAGATSTAVPGDEPADVPAGEPPAAATAPTPSFPAFEAWPARGWLAPIDADDDEAAEEAATGGDDEDAGAPQTVAGAMPAPAAPPTGKSSEEDAAAAGDEPREGEPVVAIPRPAEGVRQQRLFLTGLDEGLVREATDVVLSARRASTALLQRKLRVDYEQAMELLALLAHRGVIELAEDGTQGRVLT